MPPKFYPVEGGFGVVGSALKQAYRDISVVVLDLPHVIEDARRFWAERTEDPGVEFREGNHSNSTLTTDIYRSWLVWF